MQGRWYHDDDHTQLNLGEDFPTSVSNEALFDFLAPFANAEEERWRKENVKEP